jgi:hypothetical protein
MLLIIGGQITPTAAATLSRRLVDADIWPYCEIFDDTADSAEEQMESIADHLRGAQREESSLVLEFKTNDLEATERDDLQDSIQKLVEGLSQDLPQIETAAEFRVHFDADYGEFMAGSILIHRAGSSSTEEASYTEAPNGRDVVLHVAQQLEQDIGLAEHLVSGVLAARSVISFQPGPIVLLPEPAEMPASPG